MLQLIIVLFILAFLILFALTSIMQIFFVAPYVPSKYKVAKRMIRLAKLKKKDIVYDLGCGDGRLLFMAERKAPCRPTGFEIAPMVYLIAFMKKYLFRSKVSLKFKNFFKMNLREADVIFCYLLPEVMEKLSKKIKKECKKDTRVISNTFHLPGFTPVKIMKKDKKRGVPTVYLYRV